MNLPQRVNRYLVGVSRYLVGANRYLVEVNRYLVAKQRWSVVAALAVAYVPVLASSPGLVGADTKAYLYLDPARLLGTATSLWEADRALGTVTHQNIGFLWPIGPFYWLFDTLGVPDWVAQRLWLATLLASAGLGVRYLLRTLGFEGRGLLMAMLAYQLSPYLLHYSARISVVLLPWAALGWMIGLTVRAARTGGWRHPALLALTVVTVGSVNATSVLLAGTAPVLWLIHAAFNDHTISVRRALATSLRIGVLIVGVSLWWAAGLLIQGAYSLPVTRYTETYEVIAAASTAPEVWRGLGYWFFYGNDKFGAWIEPSVDYTQGGWLIFVSFGLVVLALGTAAVLRWRHRSYFVLLAAVGALIAVGAHPFAGPSVLGGLFERFTHTDAGLALRSLPRAVPLVALATAVLLGAGVNALWQRAPRLGTALGALVLAAVVLNNPAMWKLRMVEDNLNRPEEIPDYWLEAAAALDTGPTAVTAINRAEQSRVWEMPGSDFASYRWGNTVDPITPGLMERGYVARELVPFGSAQSAALLTSLDRRLQEGTLDPDSVAPVARLMSVGDIVHRADLSYERFRTPRPVETSELLAEADGLQQTQTFGRAVPNVAGPQQTLIDEIHLGRPSDAIHPHPVVRYQVSDPLPIVRTRPVSGAAVLVGDADGIVDAAAAGVLDVDRPLVFASDLVANPAMAERVLAEPTQIIVTDSNRRRAQRWGTIRENRGYTEAAGEQKLTYDPTDNRLFDDSTISGGVADDMRTVSEQRGPLTVQATAYGNPVTYTNDDRAFYAVDGSLDTAWVVAAFDEARGERLQIQLPEPTFLAEVRLVQPSNRGERHVTEANRRITEVELRADGRTVSRAALDERSLTDIGQTVPLGVTATVVEIEITDTNVSRRAVYPGIAPVGFAEVDFGLGPVSEVIRTPRALIDNLGAALDNHAVTVILTRERSNPQEPVRLDPELRLSRSVPLPTPREVNLVGSARLSAAANPEMIDALLAPADTGSETSAVHSPPHQSGLAATSSGHLAGDLFSRPAAMLDGDAVTAWTGRFGPQAGQWIELRAGAHPFESAEIMLDVVVDELHSTPTQLRIFEDGTDRGVFDLTLTPASAGTASDTVATVTLPVTISGRTTRIQFETVNERLTRDWYSNAMVALPVSVAEIRISGYEPLAPPAAVDTGCRSDLLWVNHEPVPIRVTGSADDALARRELTLEGCAPANLSAGDNLVMTAPGSETGLDLDQLVMFSPKPVAKPAVGVGAVSVVRHSDTSYTAEVPADAEDRWLVLGQSYNLGWRAVSDGIDLGEPVVIDGFANGWLLPAHDALAEVELRWTPQRYVDWALRISAVFVALAVVLAIKGRPYPRRLRESSRISEPPGVALRWPWEMTALAQPTKAGVMVFGAAIVAVVCAINLPTAQPWWLLASGFVGLAVVLALRFRRLCGLLPLLAATSLGIAALYVLIQQYRFRYPPDFVWPQQFEAVHVLGVIAALCLLADYAITAIQANSKQAAR